MTTTLTKNNSKAKAPPLSAAVVVDGSEPFRPRTDVLFDIETGKLGGDSDGSLLDAQTARVAAIGYMEAAKGRVVIAYDKNEAALLTMFWLVFLSVQASGAKLIGFNIHGFDIPFLIRRSWHHGVQVPRTLMSGGKYWSDTVVDLMTLWKCGGFKDYISLDNLSKFLGVGAKNGNGEHFSLLWEKDRAAAIAYLTNDVCLCADCARKMGVIVANQ